MARESYDRIVGLVLADLAVDGCIAKAPDGGECAGRSPVDRGKLGMKRSLMVEGHGIPLGRVLAPANRHDSPLLAPTLDKLDDLGPLPDEIRVQRNVRKWGRQQQGIPADCGLPGPRRGPAQHLLGTPRPENPDSHPAASQSDGLTNRRMRARMSGGVGGGGATPLPTRFQYGQIRQW